MRDMTKSLRTLTDLLNWSNSVTLCLRDSLSGLDDFKTHRASWRKAMTILRDGPGVSDPDGRAYWQHEIAAYDRAMTAFDDLFEKAVLQSDRSSLDLLRKHSSAILMGLTYARQRASDSDNNDVYDAWNSILNEVKEALQTLEGSTTGKNPALEEFSEKETTKSNSSSKERGWPEYSSNDPSTLFHAIEIPSRDPHDPRWYLIMPGGSPLPLNHCAEHSMDEARARWIARACNAALLKERP